MTLNLRQMEVFRAIMKEGSVTDAARLLNVSQPSVSEILRHAESRLGFQLFEPSKGRLKPTHAANRLYAGIERVFEEVASVNRMATSLRESRRTLLRIGSVSSLAMVIGPTLVAEFQRHHPRTNARLSVMKRAEMAQDLLAEQLEIGLTFLSEKYHGINIIEIARRPMICVVPKGHPLDGTTPVKIAQVARYPVIGVNPHLTTGKMLRAMFDKASATYAPIAEVEQYLQAWSLAQSGVGVSIVEPFSSMERFFPGATAVPLESDETLPLQLLVAENRTDWSIVSAFVVHSRKVIAAQLAGPDEKEAVHREAL